MDSGGSVLDPNTLILDPAPEFVTLLERIRIRIQVPIRIQGYIIKNKNLKYIFREKQFSFKKVYSTGIFLNFKEICTNGSGSHF